MSRFPLSSDSGMVVLSGHNCSRCTQLKDQLTKKQIQFVEYNVHDDVEAADYMRSLGLRSLPVLFNNGKQVKV